MNVMELYRDFNVVIEEKKIRIKGILLPFISEAGLEEADIISIELVDLSLFNRLNPLGTQDLRVWWCFDPLKIKRKKGIVITIDKGIKTLKAIGFTCNDIEGVYEILKEVFPEKIL